MIKHMIRFVAVAILVFALAPAGAAIVPITSVSTTTTGTVGTVGTPQTIILDSFDAGGVTYTTSTDLVTGTSVNTSLDQQAPDDINDQDNFDFNLYFGRGANQEDDEVWTTSLFGGVNWSNTNGDDADFFIFEAGGNDSIRVRPIFVGGGVGQYTILSTKAGEDDPNYPAGTVNWGDTNVVITEGARDGNNVFGLAFAITDLLDGAGAPLTNSSVIMGLDFDGYNTDIASISAVITGGPAPSTAAITSITWGSPNATIDMTGVNGTTYTCDSSTDLVTWDLNVATSAPIVPVGGVFSFTTAAGDPKKFYRIAE